jgi:hypothetical protein
VAATAKEQSRQLVGEVKTQARNVAADVRNQLTHHARRQNGNLAVGIRRMADELDRMAAERGDSAARTVVSRVADGGRQVADYLADRGPEGVLAEVQNFARRRPGAFLATALVSGFVVGRLGKGVFSAATDDAATNPTSTVSPAADTVPPVATVSTAADLQPPAAQSRPYPTGPAPLSAEPDVWAAGRPR